MRKENLELEGSEREERGSFKGGRCEETESYEERREGMGNGKEGVGELKGKEDSRQHVSLLYPTNPLSVSSRRILKERGDLGFRF